MAFVHISSNNGFEVNGREVSFIDRFVDRSGGVVYDIVNGRTIQGRPRDTRNEYRAAAAKVAAKKLASDPLAAFMARERMLNDKHHNPCGFDSFERQCARQYAKKAVAEEFGLF